MIASNEIETRHRVDLDTTIESMAETGQGHGLQVQGDERGRPGREPHPLLGRGAQGRKSDRERRGRAGLPLQSSRAERGIFLNRGRSLRDPFGLAFGMTGRGEGLAFGMTGRVEGLAFGMTGLSSGWGLPDE